MLKMNFYGIYSILTFLHYSISYPIPPEGFGSNYYYPDEKPNYGGQVFESYGEEIGPNIYTSYATGESNPFNNIDEDPEHGPYFEGDIVLDDDDPKGRNGIIGDNYRWPLGKVPYYIDPQFNSTENDLIRKAMKEIEETTCVRFEETFDGNTNDSLVYFKRSEKRVCSSAVGKRIRKQYLQLHPVCFWNKTHGKAVHEILHAVGFDHEHTRMDRDNYVEILWHKIKNSTQSNFKKHDSLDFGFSYDYSSIMHYSESSFPNVKGEITIKVLTPGAKIGQRVRISDVDACKVNAMYVAECKKRDELFSQK